MLTPFCSAMDLTIKLGALFRVVVMRLLRNMADCCKTTIDRIVDQKRSIKNEMSDLAITVTRPVLREEVCHYST